MIRKISDRDAWITNEDGDVIGVSVDSRADDPMLFIIPKTGASGILINSIWAGTKAQYDAIAVKDANTQYNIVAA